MSNLNKSQLRKKYENIKLNNLKNDILVLHIVYRIIILVLIGLLLLALYDIRYKNQKINKLINTQVIEYKTDNWDGRYNYIGHVINKTKNGDKYTLQVVGYGNFTVSEVEYYEVELGEKLPKFIMDRGAN